jgi:hypothetical protein
MFGFGVYMIDVLMCDMFMLVVLGLLFAMLVRAMFGVVFGMFLGNVRSEFRAVGSASGFDFRDFFFRELRDGGDIRFFGFLGTIVRLFVRLFFFEFGAANNGIGFRSFRSFFVLGFDETGGECGDLILV